MKKLKLITMAALLLSGGMASAELSSSLDVVMFGDVAIGSQMTQSIRIRNLSTINTVQNFTVEVSGNADEFSVTNCNTNLFPGGSCIIDITLTPQHFGAKKRKLNLDGVELLSDGTTVDVSLSVPLVGSSNNPNQK